MFFSIAHDLKRKDAITKVKVGFYPPNLRNVSINITLKAMVRYSMLV